MGVFPQPFSELDPGVYEAQAVLDVDHDYNYHGRTTEDWISPVVTLAGWHPGAEASRSSCSIIIRPSHPSKRHLKS